MMRNNIINTAKTIQQNAAIPVFYHKEWEVCEQIMRICYQNGFKVFEFTNRGENAIKLFEKLKALVKAEMPDMLLGAGTIFTVSDAEIFMALGADFIVSPILNPEVGEHCNKYDMLWIPGCMTTTEVFQATQLKAQIIKLFPGDLLGASFLRNIRPVFPNVNFMPTGGVTTKEDNLREWFNAGVVAVGMGSQLLSKNLIESGDWKTLNLNVKQAMEVVKKITNQ